jgi:hypothetical protein
MARFAKNPTEEQISFPWRIVSYCKTTATLGVKYKYNPDVHRHDDLGLGLGLAVYSDAVYTDSVERKSSTGYVVHVMGALVSFKAYRQRIITSASTEAEFFTLTYSAKEAA